MSTTSMLQYPDSHTYTELGTSEAQEIMLDFLMCSLEQRNWRTSKNKT